MSNVVAFSRSRIGNITLNVQYEMLEDGSMWYRFKLSKAIVWGEWKEVSVE